VGVLLALNVELGLGKFLERLDTSMLVSLKFEVSCVDVLGILQPKSFNIAHNAVSNKHDCLFGFFLKLVKNVLEVVFNLLKCRSSFESGLFNSVNLV